MSASQQPKTKTNMIDKMYKKDLMHQYNMTFDGLGSTESEKPRQRVSNADRKVFANPESFCNKLIIG